MPYPPSPIITGTAGHGGFNARNKLLIPIEVATMSPAPRRPSFSCDMLAAAAATTEPTKGVTKIQVTVVCERENLCSYYIASQYRAYPVWKPVRFTCGIIT